MTRLQLEHIIRAAAGNVDTTEIVIIGSQAVLGTFPDGPAELARPIREQAGLGMTPLAESGRRDGQPV